MGAGHLIISNWKHLISFQVYPKQKHPVSLKNNTHYYGVVRYTLVTAVLYARPCYRMCYKVYLTIRNQNIGNTQICNFKSVLVNHCTMII